MLGETLSGGLPRIGAYATEYYYIDHLVSIWLALPEEARGSWWVTEKAAFRLNDYGVPTEFAQVFADRDRLKGALARDKGKDPILTASFANWRDVTNAGRPNPYLPHGQGGPGNGNDNWLRNARKLDLMLCPTPYATTGFETLSTAVIHGQPKTDRWVGHKPKNENPVVAISFRWRETASALEHYRPHLLQFVEEAQAYGWEVLGHGHPLAFEKRFRQVWKKLGVRRTADFEKVLNEADVYVADCSSSSFEFAATDRPVVFLDAPCYKGCNFAPRFTHDRAGLTCRDPRQLASTVALALADPDHVAAAREDVCAELFGPRDGQSSQRAASALLEFYGA
jgi:hypothetical protein